MGRRHLPQRDGGGTSATTRLRLFGVDDDLLSRQERVIPRATVDALHGADAHPVAIAERSQAIAFLADDDESHATVQCLEMVVERWSSRYQDQCLVFADVPDTV